MDIRYIYSEYSCINDDGYSEVIKKFPRAEIKYINSHWRIPELHNNEELLKKWIQVKRHYLVLGRKRKFTYESNGRSTDFIGPSISNGCTSACVYCYVARRKGYANPITIYTNRDEMIKSLKEHIEARGKKTNPNQCHPEYWTYDIGCNNDVSIDSTLNDTVKELVGVFRRTPTAMASFATKSVNTDMLSYDPQGKTRIRFSLMPEALRKVVDIRTSKIEERLAAANLFLQAGYEVHFNLSPVIIVPGRFNEWLELFQQMNDILSPEVKEQAAAEIIFLTHNKDLHELNLQWHPKAEELLWTPYNQEQKISLNGQTNIRYEYKYKQQVLNSFLSHVKKHLPWMRIRYAF